MRLSYSQLSVYRRCPKQYDFMSIRKIPRRMSSGESFGSSIHNTLRKWGELEMLREMKIPVKNQLKLFSEQEDVATHHPPLELTTLLTMFRSCFIAEGYKNRATMDEALLRGETLLQSFFQWWKHEKRTVVSVESGFRLEIQRTDENADTPIVLTGRFDRIERIASGLHIIDYKTGEKQSQELVDSDLQLSIYALAAAKEFGEPVFALSLLFLSENGIVERTTQRTPSQLSDAMTTIRLLSEGIDRKDFQATPTKEKCRSCPYGAICPFKMPLP